MGGTISEGIFLETLCRYKSSIQFGFVNFSYPLVGVIKHAQNFYDEYLFLYFYIRNLKFKLHLVSENYLPAILLCN